MLQRYAIFQLCDTSVFVAVASLFLSGLPLWSTWFHAMKLTFCPLFCRKSNRGTGDRLLSRHGRRSKMKAFPAVHRTPDRSAILNHDSLIHCLLKHESNIFAPCLQCLAFEVARNCNTRKKKGLMGQNRVGYRGERLLPKSHP